jgi:hypothetical protein
VDPQVVNRRQAQELLTAVSYQGRIGPRLVAFFACLYIAGLRPGEAVELREEVNLDLPDDDGWGTLYLRGSAPCTGAAWSASGRRRDPRELKHRAREEVRPVPCHPALTRYLHWHITEFGVAPDGWLFRGERGGDLSESVYGRAWRGARLLAFTPAVAASPLAGRPYDLRHACLSTWLNGEWSPPRSPNGRATAFRSSCASTPSASPAATRSIVAASKMHSATTMAARPLTITVAGFPAASWYVLALPIAPGTSWQFARDVGDLTSGHGSHLSRHLRLGRVADAPQSDSPGQFQAVFNVTVTTATERELTGYQLSALTNCAAQHHCYYECCRGDYGVSGQSPHSLGDLRFPCRGCPVRWLLLLRLLLPRLLFLQRTQAARALLAAA